MKKHKQPKLSPQQLQDKLARDNLQHLMTKLKTDWSIFKRIKTFEDLLFCAGYEQKTIAAKYFPNERSALVTWLDIKEWLSDRSIELETAIYLRNNPPKNEWSIYDEERTAVVAQSNQIESTGSINTELPTPELLLSTSVDKKQEEHLDKDYGLEPSSKENCSLLWFQKKYTKEILDDIRIKKKRGLYLVAKAGDGKTFIAGAIFRRLIDSNFQSTTSNISPWPYIYITKAAVVEQIKWVFKNKFNLSDDDVLVIGIDQLRSRFGELFVSEKTIVVHGQEQTIWVWRKLINPLVIVWDESHVLKNPSSTQSSIAQSYNNIESEDTYQIFSSATPGVRVQDFKCFAVSTRVHFMNGPLTNITWPLFAQQMCDGFTVYDKNGEPHNAQPQDYCPEAVKRLMDYLKNYMVRVKGVKSQFKAHNAVKLIEFSTPAEEQSYNTAVEDMMNKIAKVHAKQGLTAGEVRLQEITILLYFRMKAEILKAPILAKMMWQSVNGCNPDHPQKKFAALCATNFKQTIAAIVKILVNDYNVPRHLISLTWGGGQAVSKKAKQKALLSGNKDVMAAFEESGISFEDLNLDLVEAKMEEEIDPSLRLGIQSKQQREEDKIKFLSGNSHYHLFTYKAGGAGLSLHHTDDFTLHKVRHKESGYAVEEDIPSIPTRPRITFMAATWSPFEIVQGAGRAARITSLSDTYQYLLYYARTVEARVAARASMALVSLREVIKQPESWENLIIGREASKIAVSEDNEESGDGYYGDSDDD